MKSFSFLSSLKAFAGLHNNRELTEVQNLKYIKLVGFKVASLVE